jgi:hypothetical protein
MSDGPPEPPDVLLPGDQDIAEVLNSAYDHWQEAVAAWVKATGSPEDLGNRGRAEWTSLAEGAALISTAGTRLAHAIIARVHLEEARKGEQAAEQRTQMLLSEIDRSERDDRSAPHGAVDDRPPPAAPELPTRPHPGAWYTIEPPDGSLGRVRFHKAGTYRVEVDVHGGVDVIQRYQQGDPP